MEKKYQSHLYNLDAQASGLVGFFDADCSYVIEEKLVKELIICNKVITSFENNLIKAIANVGSFKFNFNIYLQDGIGGMKRAGLFIVEKCTLGAVDKDLETYLDSIVAPDSPMFMEEVKKKYHLYTRDESTGIDIDINNLKLTELIKYLTEINRKYKVMLPIQISKEKEYIDRVLKILKEDPNYGQQVIKEFKERLLELLLNKQGQKGSSKNPKTNILTQKQLDPVLREARILLDNIVNKNKHMLAPESINRINKCQDNLIIMLANLKEPVPTPVKQEAKKKKKEEKKADDGGDDKKKKKKDDKKASSSKPPKKEEEKKQTADSYNPKETKTSKIKVSKQKQEHEEPAQQQEFSMFGSGIHNTYDTSIKKRKNKNKETEMER